MKKLIYIIIIIVGVFIYGYSNAFERDPNLRPPPPPECKPNLRPPPPERKPPPPNLRPSLLVRRRVDRVDTGGRYKIGVYLNFDSPIKGWSWFVRYIKIHAREDISHGYIGPCFKW